VLWHPLSLVGEAPRDGYTRVAGAIHIHTTHSDGGGTPEEVVQAARAEGLDFVVITDHNNLGAKPFEGYHDGILVLVGSEISTDQGHIVGLGMRAPVFCFCGDARESLDDVRELGGLPIVAHPLRESGDYGANTWTGWNLPGPWGMELMNGKSQLDDAGWLGWLRMLALYPVNSRLSLLSLGSRPRATLDRWDEHLAHRSVVGTFGADAHSRIPITKKKGIRFPPYGPLIGLTRNHVLLDRPLTGEAETDTKALVEAIAHGRLYVAVDGLAPGAGFSFTAEADGRRFTMGETLTDAAAPTLRVAGRLPEGARVDLFKDGQILTSAPAPLTLEAPGEGVYRIEAYAPGWTVPWVLSNPIYVMSAERAREREARAAWPEPVEPPPATRLLDGFEEGSSFRAEFDESSAMEMPAFDPQGGVDGGRAARLAFRLGAPGPGRAYTWCALVSREARDLSGTKGLTFWIRGDGVYRIWVQVRDENPASADEGTEWWFGSVRTSREWRRVAIPYDRLYTLNSASDGKVDLDRVRGLVFVLDHKAVLPDTRGTIWIDDLGVYD
jgi:hypothetical protein